MPICPVPERRWHLRGQRELFLTVFTSSSCDTPPSPTQEKLKFPSAVTTLVSMLPQIVAESSPEILAPTLTVSKLQMNIWLLEHLHVYNKLFVS